jgi:hypothetical protein
MNKIDGHKESTKQSKQADNVVYMADRRKQAQSQGETDCHNGVCELNWKPQRTVVSINSFRGFVA